MAEAVFRHAVKERQLSSNFHIDSAGTAAYHVGDKPDSRSAATCRLHGVSISHRARQVNRQDFSKFHYILCMDESNLEDLQSMQQKGDLAKVQLFGDYGQNKTKRIIEDPYYGGNGGFKRNFEQVQICSEGLLNALGFTE